MSLNVIMPYRFGAAGGGASTADTDSYFVGGIFAAWTFQDNTQYWNGSSWSTGTALPAARGLGGGRGNLTDFIYAGGCISIYTADDDSYTWNGSSWATYAASMIVARSTGFALGGNTSSAICQGGNAGSGGAQYQSAEEWDGSSWSSITTALYGGQGTGGDGHTTDFIKCGGGSPVVRNAESWDGSSWSNETLFPSGYADAYVYGGSCGSNKSSYMQVTNTASTGANIAFKYDGSSWAAADSIQSSPQYAGMGGNSGNAMLAGSWQNGNASETYDGSSWTSEATLTTGKSCGNMGGNT